MELSPPPEREAFVRGIPDECVPEAKSSGNVGVALDEFAQSIPRLGGGRHERVVFENLGDDRSGERDAENRSPPEKRAVSRSELIDPGCNEPLDRFGQLLGRIRLLADACKLTKEERVARGTFHERGDLVLRESAIARCGDRERARVVFGERVET